MGLTFLSGCGGSEAGEDGIPYYYPKSYESIESDLRSATFQCSDPNQFPKNVGMILMNSDGNQYHPSIGQCTGFLTSHDIVATNSHCIPDHLKSRGAKCDSDMAIRFMPTSSDEEHL